MPQIVLTDEQVRTIEQANELVMVTDSRGNAYTPIRLELTAEQVAELKRRAATPGPTYTSDQVRRRLQALQAEWDRTGGFDHAYRREFMKKLDETDPPQIRHRGKAS
jgi:hypothetical protein